MSRYRLTRLDAVEPAKRGKTKPIAIGEVDLDLLVELLLPTSEIRSRTQLRMQLEDQMAAAMESAMRGKAATFLDIYEYVPDGPEPGGIHKVRRMPGPLLREFAKSHCFVPVDPGDVVPQPMILRDLRTGATNELLTRGGRAELRGMDLQFDANAPDEGLFIVDSIDETEYRVANVSPPADPTIGVMQAIEFSIPADLPGGSYSLEARNRPAKSALKAGRLPHELRIEET